MKTDKQTFLRLLESLVIQELSTRKVSMGISSAIEQLRGQLRKKRLVFNANFLAPDPDDKYGDFGSLEISIDLTVGRAKENSKGAIERFVVAWARRTGVSKFFNFIGSSQTGQKLSLEFELKQKYIQSYMGDREELPVDAIDVNNTDYEVLPKTMKLL